MLNPHDGIQRPDNYDFASTRAINAPSSPSSETGSHHKGDYDEKKEPSSPYVQSVNEQIPEEDDELNPVVLEKAFKFAARSSIILV